MLRMTLRLEHFTGSFSSTSLLYGSAALVSVEMLAAETIDEMKTNTRSDLDETRKEA